MILHVTRGSLCALNGGGLYPARALNDLGLTGTIRPDTMDSDCASWLFLTGLLSFHGYQAGDMSNELNR